MMGSTRSESDADGAASSRAVLAISKKQPTKNLQKSNKIRDTLHQIFKKKLLKLPKF